MKYVSVVPKPPLAEFVERFWYSGEAPSHQKVRIAPTGTIELVFNLNEDELGFYDAEKPAGYQRFSGGVFSGAHARPLFVETRAHVMGVHFKPGGAFRFLGVPAGELVHTHVDVEALWGKATQELGGQLTVAMTPAGRFRILEQALLARLTTGRAGHQAVGAALDIFEREVGGPRTRDLAARLGLSQRHFIQLFSDQVGVTPKQFGRVKRFQRALNLAQRRDQPDWSDIAASCGYFDQSHFIHEFRELSGFKPTEFHRQRHQGVLANPPIGG